MTAADLRSEHERYARVESVRLGGVPMQVEWLPYGDGAAGVELVATYGLLELEYAAFRRGAAVMARPDRGVLAIGGADRVDFLNRMVTQELKGLPAGEVREAFWLNRKGRIEADLLLCQMPPREGQASIMLADLDVHDVARAVETLGAFLFSEDVQLADARAAWVRLSVHGPEGAALLHGAGANEADLEAVLKPGACGWLTLAGASVAVARRDQCASPGLELWVPADHAAAVWNALVSQHDLEDAGRRRARPVGWYAYNIARIEGGTPLFHVDFGPDSLPHETGVLGRRTSFRKGCYLGQEVVARMESLGHPKQKVVGLRTQQDRLPTAGSPIFERGADGEPGNPVGAITSSALSPMLGAAPIALAMVKHAFTVPGTELLAPAEGDRATVVVQPSLEFIPSQAQEAAP